MSDSDGVTTTFDMVMVCKVVSMTGVDMVFKKKIWAPFQERTIL